MHIPAWALQLWRELCAAAAQELIRVWREPKEVLQENDMDELHILDPSHADALSEWVHESSACGPQYDYTAQDEQGSVCEHSGAGEWEDCGIQGMDSCRLDFTQPAMGGDDAQEGRS